MLFKSKWGKEYEIRFIATEYIDGNTAVLVESVEPDIGWWEPYGDATVNLGEPLLEGMAYLDTNNMQDMADFMMMHGWCEPIGFGHSGFCTYPLVKFTDEFLNTVCEKGDWE